MKDKRMTASEAAGMIKNGMHLGVGAGMTMNPMPIVREIIKNGIKGLTLTPVLTGGYVADLMIGAGCVETVQFPQIVLDEFACLTAAFADQRHDDRVGAAAADDRFE